MRDGYAVMIRSTGGPEVLEISTRRLDAPGPGEVLLAQSAVGLNFVDIYHRSGQFGAHEGPPLPAVLGVQGAGIVEEIGPGIDSLKAGDRVGYVGTLGAYADRRLIPANRLIRLPDDVGTEFAAASLVRGLTAEYLLRRLHRVERGETILIHAAASGVGLIACQWAKALGATVIGTTSTDEKAAFARMQGCDHVLVYTREDWVGRVRDITGGRGVSVVYDSIGKDTFMKSLQCLATRGMAINFGTTSGQVEPLSLQALHSRSLSVCRPTLPNFIEDRAEYETAAAAFFEVVRRGIVRVTMGARFALRNVGEAHAAFEGRRLSGLPVLIP